MLQGTLLSLLAAVLGSTITVGSKHSLEAVAPVAAGALSYFGAALAGLMAYHSEQPAARWKPSRRDLAFFTAALILGAILAPLFLMYGLANTSATFGAVLANLEPVATVGIAWFIVGEGRTRLGQVATVLILLGVVTFSIAEGFTAQLGGGPLLVAVAYLLWAADINLMARIAGISPITSTIVRGLVGALIMGTMAFASQEMPQTWRDAIECIGVGAIGFGLSFMFVLRALPLVGSARAGALLSTAPVFGYAIGAVVEGSVPDWTRIAAIAVLVLGIAVSIYEVYWLRRDSGA